MATEKAQIVLSAVDKTKAAFDSAKRNFDTLKSSAERLPAVFGSIGLAITGAFEAISLKNAIDAADELSKLSQKTGITVESLSALKYAGELSDVSIEDLATGIKKLGNNMAAAAGGNKEAIATFEAIGVKATTTAGVLRNTDDVLGDIADRFASYKDGAGKAALATELFGKNGAALIPFLNAGSRGLAELKAEAEKLGVVMGGQLGKDAEAFNDNLTRLAAGARGAKVALLGDLLPALIAITNQFVDARLAYGSFLTGFVDVLRGSTQSGGLAKTREEISGITKALAELNAAPKTGFKLIDNANADLRERKEAELKLLQQREDFQKRQQAREALAAGEGVVESNAKLRGPALKEAPIKKATGASATDDALQQLKRTLDGRIQAIQQNLANEQDLLKFNETFVAAVYQAGETSLQSYYAAQDEIRRRGLEEQRTALTAQIEAEQAYQRALPKDKNAERIDSDNKIAAAKAKIAAAEREFSQASALSAVQRATEVKAQKQQLDAFNATLEDLITGGRARAGEVAEIAARVEAARQKLLQGSDPNDPDAVTKVNAKTEAFRQQLMIQRDFNLARDQFNRITDAGAAAEEALGLAQRANGVGLLEREGQIRDLRTQELAQLGKLLEATRALANVNPQNEALQKSLRDLELAYGRLKEAADPTKLRLDGAADNIGDAIANGLSRANTEGKNLKQIISGIGTQIFDIVEKELVTKPLAESIANFVKGAGGQGAGENLIGKLFGLNSPKTAVSTDPTTQLTASLGALQTSGIDPTISALSRLAQAFDVAANRITTPAANAARFGDITGANYGNEGKRAANDAAAGDAAAALGETLMDTRTNGQKVADLFKDMPIVLGNVSQSANVASLALRYLPAIIQSLSSSSGSSSGGSSGGGWASLVSGLFSGSSSGGADAALGSDLALAFHSGGIVGVGGAPRQISPSVMQYAARYHSGGMAGMKPNEVPAVLMGGPKGQREEVLHASDPRHADNGGRSAAPVYHTTINFTLAQPADRGTQSQIAARVADGLRRGGRNR